MIVENSAYEICEYDKVYQSSIAYSLKADKINITNPRDISENLNKSVLEVIHSSSGEICYKNKQLINKVLCFHYYVPIRNINNIENIYDLRMTMNKRDYFIAGRYIKAKTGLLRSVSSFLTTDKKYYKITLNIELECEKPLYSDFYPNLGYYFNVGGDSSKRRRIQFSSNPSRILSDKTNFPDALHVVNGFGYYSDFHPELNISDPIPLKENGDILLDYKDIIWNESFEHFITSWNGLSLPRKVYGE